MPLTPEEQIASAEATREALEPILEDLRDVHEQLKDYRNSVPQEMFPDIHATAEKAIWHLERAFNCASHINSKNAHFMASGYQRRALEQLKEAASEGSDSSDPGRTFVERLAAELQDLGVGADANIVVHVSVENPEDLLD